MHVGVNLRYLQKPITGIERSTLEMIKALDTLEGGHRLSGYITSDRFTSAPAREDLLACQRLRLQRVPLIHEDIVFRLAWDMLKVGQQAARDQVDVFWGPAFSLPLLSCPGVVTIFDLAYIHYPEGFNRVTHLWHRVITPWAARRARAVITISEYSRRDIVRFLHVPPERVQVIPLACGRQFRRLPEGSAGLLETRARLGIQRPFLLTVSAISPRKNLVHLVEVYARLRRERRLPHALVLVGRNAWLYEEVYEAVRRERVEADVIFTGPIADSDLVNLYNLADVFIFPSLSEGFGLPVLEAMACGAPVIAADSSSLPEVVGDAGVLVPPTDKEALATAIEDLTSRPERRERLRRLGVERAEQFSWEASARRLLEVFSMVSGQRT